jgi:hypothetical protein
VDAGAERIRRLHREAEGEQLPFAAHRRHRAGGKPLEVQIRTWACTGIPNTAWPRTGDTKRPEEDRRPDQGFNETIGGCGRFSMEGRRRRFRANADGVSRAASSSDSIFVLTPQGKVIDLAARLARRSTSLMPFTPTSDIAVAARVSMARWSPSTTC